MADPVAIAQWIEAPAGCVELCVIDKLAMNITPLTYSPYDVDFLSYKAGFTNSMFSTGTKDKLSSAATFNSAASKYMMKRSAEKGVKYLAKTNALTATVAGLVDFEDDIKECIERCKCQE